MYREEVPTSRSVAVGLHQPVLKVRDLFGYGIDVVPFASVSIRLQSEYIMFAPSLSEWLQQQNTHMVVLCR